MVDRHPHRTPLPIKMGSLCPSRRVVRVNLGFFYSSNFCNNWHGNRNIYTYTWAYMPACIYFPVPKSVFPVPCSVYELILSIYVWYYKFWNYNLGCIDPTILHICVLNLFWYEIKSDIVHCNNEQHNTFFLPVFGRFKF